MSQTALENALVELTAWRRDMDRRFAQVEAVVGQLYAARNAGGQARGEYRASDDVPVNWSAPPPAPGSGAGAAFPAAGPAWGPSPQQAPQPAPAKPAALPVRHYDLTIKPGESIDIPSALNAGRKKRVFGWLFAIVVLGALTALAISAMMSNR